MFSTTYARILSLIGLLAVALVLSACGGDDTTTAAAETAGQATGSSGDERAAGDEGGQATESGEATDPLDGEPPPPVEKIEVPPAPKGSDDSIQTFGKEADAAQSAEGAQAVNGFFQGRADGRWADACYYLSSDMGAALAQTAEEGADCEASLRNLTEKVPRKALNQQAKVRVGSVRVDGDRGFVVYKGAGGVWYAVPLSKEGGEWKLGALSGLPLN